MPSNDQAPARRQFIEEVYNLRLLGALPVDVRRHAHEQKWDVDDDQLQRIAIEADRMLAQAAQEVHGSVDDPRDRLFLHHFAARRALFARAMAVSDYKCALSCLQDEAKLLNLYPEKANASSETNVVLVINEVIIESKGNGDNHNRAAPEAEAIPGK